MKFSEKVYETNFLKRDILKALFEKFQRAVNVNDDRAGKAAVTNGNVEVVQKVIKGHP